MNRGLEISADAADSPRSMIVEQVANGVAVRMAVLYLLLPGAGRRRGRPSRDRRPTEATRDAADRTWCAGRGCSAASPPTCCCATGVIAAIGAGLSGRRRDGGRRRRAGRAARPGRPAHPPARAGPRGRRDGRDRHAGRGARRLHRRARDGEHRPGRRHRRASSSRSGGSAGDAGWVDVHPVGAVTVGLRGERLAELGAMADSAAGVRVFSDDGHCVCDPVLMRRALEYVKAFDGVIAQHAQEPRLTEGAQMHEGVVSARARACAAGRRSPRRRSSPATCCSPSTSAPGCTSATCRRPARSRSSAGRRPAGSTSPPRSPRTTCCSPTSWCAATTRCSRSTRRCAPPTTSQALRAALADGTIDVVATDHAPHPVEDKDCEWAAAAFGMTGLETALSVVQHDDGRHRAAGLGRASRERMSAAPGADRAGRRPGPAARGRASRPT